MSRRTGLTRFGHCALCASTPFSDLAHLQILQVSQVSNHVEAHGAHMVFTRFGGKGSEPRVDRHVQVSCTLGLTDMSRDGGRLFRLFQLSRVKYM